MVEDLVFRANENNSHFDFCLLLSAVRLRRKEVRPSCESRDAPLGLVSMDLSQQPHLQEQQCRYYGDLRIKEQYLTS